MIQTITPAAIESFNKQSPESRAANEIVSQVKHALGGPFNLALTAVEVDTQIAIEEAVQKFLTGPSGARDRAALEARGLNFYLAVLYKVMPTTGVAPIGIGEAASRQYQLREITAYVYWAP